MLAPHDLANALTTALRRGEWTAARLVERAQQRLKAKSRWIARVCQRAATTFAVRPRRNELFAHLASDVDVVAICEEATFKLWLAVHREPPPKPPQWLDGKALRPLPTLNEL